MKSINAIAWKLGIPAKELKQLSEAGKDNYRKRRRLIGGKRRTITVPRKRLMKVQKRICSQLLTTLEPHEHLHGSIKGKSALTNAAAHMRGRGTSVLVTMDIADFFPSITPLHVYDAWDLHFDLSPNTASLLTRLTTVDHCLPQGAPTSPSLANLVLHESDKEIRQICSAKGVRYTRYLDDLSFSGAQAEELIQPTSLILQKIGFKVSRRKVQHMRPGSKQKLTGYVINGVRPSVGRAYFDQVRAAIHQLKHLPRDSTSFEDELTSIKGKINYVKQTNPRKAQSLQRQLKSQLDEATP